VTKCRDSRSGFSKKQGRDDSIKQFSIQPHLIDLEFGKIELCTELFYVIVPTLFLWLFADLLFLHLLMFFRLFSTGLVFSLVPRLGTRLD